MANGDGKGFITWQTVAVAMGGLLASGFILLEKNTIDHLDGLDHALGEQVTALNRMAGSMENLSQTNNRLQESMGRIFDRLHLVEVDQSATQAQVVTNEHDLAQLRNEFNHTEAERTKPIGRP